MLDVSREHAASFHPAAPRGGGALMPLLGWLVTFALCVAVVWRAHYQVHDADSRLYAAMTADMARTPLWQWCAPQWGGHWAREGLFFEHPPGMLWAGTFLVRAGFPAFCALYVVNFAAFFLSLALLWRIGGCLGGRALGRLAVLGWMATPAFMQYLVRGDQEHPVTLALLLGLYALVGGHAPGAFVLLWASALSLGIFVKGLAGLALLPVGALYWLRYLRTAASAGGLVLGTLAALASAWAFDTWYQHVTATSFWQHYFANQVAYSVGSTHSLLSKAYNLLYYAARPLWFAWPLLVALAVSVPQARRRGWAPWRSQAWSLGWLVSAVFVLGFSLADRKADRYIFPMYPALALSAAWALLQGEHGPSGAVRYWVEKRGAALPYTLMACVVLGVLLKVYLGTYHYTFIRLWPGAS